MKIATEKYNVLNTTKQQCTHVTSGLQHCHLLLSHFPAKSLKMSSDITEEFQTRKEEFQSVCKRILKRNLTRNREKHREYITDLVEAYNEIISLIEPHYASFSATSRKVFDKESEYLRGKTAQAYKRLGISLTAPEQILVQISTQTVSEDYTAMLTILYCCSCQMKMKWLRPK